MRTIQIDANLVHDENGEIYLSTAVVEYFNLCDGEKVLAYEGNEIWNAVIHKFVLENKELWYVELCDLFGTMNQYQEEWNNIVEENSVIEEVKDVDEVIKKKSSKKGKDFDKANLNKEYTFDIIATGTQKE